MMKEILQELIKQMEKQQTYSSQIPPTIGSSIQTKTWDSAIGLINAQLILLRKSHKTATGGNQVSF